MTYKSGVASLVLLMVLFAHSVLAADYRIAKALSVSQQQITLTITPGERTFSGETKLTYKISQPVDYIAYHSLGLTLEQVELTYQDKQVLLPVIAADEFDIVRHNLPFKLEESAELTIRFTGLVGEQGRVQGLYEVSRGEGPPTLFTQFQEMEARRVFPAVDDPGIKTEFTLTLDIPAGLQALHNTRPIETLQQGSRQLIRFAPTPKINTDVLALAVGEFNATELKGAGVPATAYMPKNVRQSVPAELGTLIHQSISYLSEYLDSPFPYDRLDFFIAPIGTLAGMENVSLIALNTNQLPGTDASAGELCRFRKLIAHEVAHTWFGHNVTMQWYDDYWLNESFSEFFAAKVVANYYPDNDACTYTPQNSAFIGDNHSAPALKRIVRDRADNEGIGGLYYTKGRALLNMLEAHVGDATLRQVMRQYVDAHQGGHATTADFTGLFPKSLRVAEIVDAYLTQSGYPLVTLSKLNDKLVLSQQSFHVDADRRWTIPLQLKLWNGHEVRTLRLVLSEASMLLPQVDADAQDAVLIDPAGVGYFRHIDRSGNPRFPIERRTMADRLADMDNQEALTKMGLLDYTRYIQGLIELLCTQPADSLEASKALDILKDAFVAQVPAHLQPQFAGFLAQHLPMQRPWQALLTQSTGGRWLELYGMYLKSPEAIRFARKYAASRPLDQLRHRASVLRVLAKNSSNDEYQGLLKLFNTLSRPTQEDLLDSLGYVANAQQVSLFYDFLLSEATRSFVIDYRFQFPAFQPLLRPVAAKYLQQHKAQIQARIPDDQLQWFPYNFITGCSEQDSALLRRTFADWLTIPGLEKKLAIVEEHIRRCHRDTRKARDDIAAM
ncbi:M1 family aminopeptidase [Pseudoalteromonas rubra]|nr:M1 family aminopeptidase [Pseudoalteromonas rubra]